MKPFLLVKKEIEQYPWQAPINDISFQNLSLEITNACTNQCAHCGVFSQGSPTQELSLDTVSQLLDQAAAQGMRSISLWGGEPFLHPAVFEIIEYAIKKGLSVHITTNGFWAQTKATADQVFETLSSINNTRQITLTLSCDYFHQSQPLTPVQNIANILTACLTKYPVFSNITINYLNLVYDPTKQQLEERLLQEKTVPADIVRSFMNNAKHWVKHSLDIHSGRAIALPKNIRNSGNISVSTLYSNQSLSAMQKHPCLLINSTGSACLIENLVGEDIFPIGNIYKDTLTTIIKNINHDQFLVFLGALPLKYFIFPFRKYVDLAAICHESHSLREALNCLFRKEQTDFDQTDLLNTAREQLRQPARDPEFVHSNLKIIEQYGDITDRPLLSMLMNSQNYSEQLKQYMRTLELLYLK